MTAAILGQEDHAHRVLAGGGQLEVELGAQEGVGDLHQDAGAVAGPGIGPYRAAMGQAHQDLQALLDDAPAFEILDVADETDTARIVLIGRIVETLDGGKGMKVHR